MSRLLARIMLALLMLPVAALVYTVAIALLMESVIGFRRGVAPFLGAGAITAVFVATWWVLLWLGVVRWTRLRAGLTVAAAGVAAGAGAAIAMAVSEIGDDFGAFAGGVAAILLWLVGTVFIWRETAGERAAATGGSAVIACPSCGYNLTGLARCACPECGASFRLEELLVRGSADGELNGVSLLPSGSPVARVTPAIGDATVVGHRDAS